MAPSPFGIVRGGLALGCKKWSRYGWYHHAGPDMQQKPSCSGSPVRMQAQLAHLSPGECTMEQGLMHPKPCFACRHKRAGLSPGEAELVRGWRRRGRPRRRSRRGGPKGREVCALELQVHVHSIAQHGQADESKQSVGQAQQSPA